MEAPSDIIRRAREDHHLTVQGVAEAAQMSIEDYRDVEAYEEEIEQAVSLEKVLRICAKLALSVEDLFGAPNGDVMLTTPVAVQGLVNDYIARNNLTQSEFEDRVGWDGIGRLCEAEEMLRRPIMFFKALAQRMDVDWRLLVRPYVISATS